MEPVISLSLGRPTSGGLPGAMRTDSSAPDIERRLRAALAAFVARAQAGEAGPRAAVDLLAPGSERQLAAIAVELSAHMAGDGPAARPANGALHDLAPAAYELADVLVEAGRFREAATLLCAVAGLPGGDFDGMLGLAVCALRLGRPEVARALSQECLKRDPRHPRACCIAAHCELKRGDRRSAQSYYALAARLARTRPEFRDDLRAAQRALLLMHLA